MWRPGGAGLWHRGPPTAGGSGAQRQPPACSAPRSCANGWQGRPPTSFTSPRLVLEGFETAVRVVAFLIYAFFSLVFVLNFQHTVDEGTPRCLGAVPDLPIRGRLSCLSLSPPPPCFILRLFQNPFPSPLNVLAGRPHVKTLLLYNTCIRSKTNFIITSFLTFLVTPSHRWLNFFSLLGSEFR